MLTLWSPLAVCIVLIVATVCAWVLMLVHQGKSAEAEGFVERIAEKVAPLIFAKMTAAKSDVPPIHATGFIAISEQPVNELKGNDHA